jgi:hypothetical protein
MNPESVVQRPPTHTFSDSLGGLPGLRSRCTNAYGLFTSSARKRDLSDKDWWIQAPILSSCKEGIPRTHSFLKHGNAAADVQAFCPETSAQDSELGDLVGHFTEGRERMSAYMVPHSPQNSRLREKQVYPVNCATWAMSLGNSLNGVQCPGIQNSHTPHPIGNIIKSMFLDTSQVPACQEPHYRAALAYYSDIPAYLQNLNCLLFGLLPQSSPLSVHFSLHMLVVARWSLT